MSFARGDRLASYEIISQIGAGGMGEVYRAHDSKLRRDVAVKVLPASLAGDSERRGRLIREAHVLASLNHPAIAGIYDLVDEQVLALVLELVEGPTLTERIASGPLPIAVGVDIAVQIADALDVAHERGIVHRDLKPGNIKLTADGRVKVLDFGLAKALAADDASTSPTVTGLQSDPGMILGTAPYMSPEQAQGKPVDKRVDIWAFGCVVFEMLAGRRAFDGSSFTDVVVAIMTTDPDWSLLPKTTPERLVELLKRTLRRSLRERLRDIGDARADLEMAKAPPRPPEQPRAANQPRLPVEYQRLTDFVGVNSWPAISPDGKMVAFIATTRGRRHVWLRLLTGGTSLQLTHDDADHEQPRWAPDSSSLIYYRVPDEPGASGTICEVSAFGGAPRPIAPALGGGDISHDGRRIAAFQMVDGRVELASISRDGVHVDFVRPLPAVVVCECPRWSPDDKLIAFHGDVVRYFDQRIFVTPSTGGTARDIVRGAILRGLAWQPDGRGLVYSSSTGSALPYPPVFSLRAINVDGSDDRQLTFGDASYVQPDAHGSSRLLASRIRGQSDIWRFSVSGTPEENTKSAVRITHQAGRVQTPSVSPDGSEVVYLSDSGGRANLWVTVIASGATRQITFSRDGDSVIGVPAWSPTGERIAFLVSRRGDAELWTVKPDGSGLRQLHAGGFYACWSHDGQWLYFSPPRDRPWRIVKARVDGTEVVDVRADNALAPAVARDGTLYFACTDVRGAFGDFEICAARVEHGTAELLTRVSGTRVPLSSVLIHMFLSPDGAALAMPLSDGLATDLWVLPARGGALKPVTAFAGRAIMISRRVSWAPDSQSLFAAVEESDADVISFTGLT